MSVPSSVTEKLGAAEVVSESDPALTVAVAVTLSANAVDVVMSAAATATSAASLKRFVRVFM